MLHIKLSLLNVGVHAPQTLQGHPSSWKTKFDLNLTQENTFRGVISSNIPLTTSPLSHFRSPAIKAIYRSARA